MIKQLLVLLKTKVLNDRYDPEGVYRKKAMKLFMEIYLAIERMNPTDPIIKTKLSEHSRLISSHTLQDPKLAKYDRILQIYYRDNQTSEIIADLRSVILEDRVMGYILAFVSFFSGDLMNWS